MATNAHDVAAAVLARGGPVEAMQLQKLVYYSQAWHLALLDEPLFMDTIQAWRDGPVALTLWEQHRGLRNVHGWPPGNPEKLSETSAKVVSLVCEVYGRLSGDDLSELTHSELPWRTARVGASNSERSKAIIRHDVMKQFYRTRSLARRSVADLVSGGLNSFSPELDSVERRHILAGLREELRQTPPVDEPGSPEPFGSAFHTHRDHNEPPLVTARLNRERPRRDSASQ